MVVGEWEGLVKKDHATLPEGSVRLMIRANSTYLFAGQTATTAGVGSGDLEARDGRLVGDTEKRAVTFTLYDHKGKAILYVESTNRETGARLRGEFTRAQMRESAVLNPRPLLDEDYRIRSGSLQ
jgi:hypothetical protein